MYSLPKTVTRQRRDCDLNLGPSAPESSTRLPSHQRGTGREKRDGKGGMRKELGDEKRERYIIGKRREKEAEHEKEESGNSVNIFGEIRSGAAILAES